MTGVLITRVKSQLTRSALKPGGMMVRDAIQRAEAAIALTNPARIESIDLILAELDTICAADAQSRTVDGYARVYHLASSIIDISICMPGSEIDSAARALCDLADRGMTLGVWDHQAVEVHAQGLKLLRHAGKSMTTMQRQSVVLGLQKVTKRRLGDLPPVSGTL